jgi:hypothetical protein
MTVAELIELLSDLPADPDAAVLLFNKEGQPQYSKLDDSQIALVDVPHGKKAISIG